MLNIGVFSTSLRPYHPITRQRGFDERVGDMRGLYGAGLYFSDSPSKADQVLRW